MMVFNLSFSSVSSQAPQHIFRAQFPMIYPLAAFSVLLVVPAALVAAHDGHDHDLQMPLDYVRYPYQAIYPGDDEGLLLTHLFTLTLILM